MKWMIAYNNNMCNPIIKDVGRGLHMLLLLYAIIHCLAAYVLHLVCTIFATAIPTLSNILMKMFLLLFYCFFDCIREKQNRGAKSKSGSGFGAQTREDGGGGLLLVCLCL